MKTFYDYKLKKLKQKEKSKRKVLKEKIVKLENMIYNNK